MTDPHFLVWMRPAAFPNFKKLWGQVTDNTDKKLQLGTYQIIIDNNW